ncbi:MAG: ADP-ribosylation factor-like protein [Promethearchaeota archaeon]
MVSPTFNALAKISIMGHPAVGKTTMLKLLAKTDNFDPLYIPTQGFDLEAIKLKNYNLKVWDFGGQKAYLKYLEDYLEGSDLVFIVTDSTPRNVLNSKKLIELAKNLVDDECTIIAIANKQDLCKDGENRMNPKLVEDLLHIKTYGLTAINPTEKKKLIEIIEKELNHTLIRKGLKESEF